MQATAAAPVTAYEAFKQAQGSPNFSPIDLHSPHFFIQMGWQWLNVDTPAIMNKRLLRGEITPCMSWQQKAHIMEIPEGSIIEGSKELDRDGRETWARYWKYAYHEAKRLVELEAATAQKDGLWEVQALYRHSQLYQDVDLNHLFYPDGLNNLPAKNAEMIEYLKATIERIRMAPLSIVKHEYYVPILLEVGQELIKATEAVEKVQLARLRLTHSALKLPHGQPERKIDYDLVDEEMLLRTGEPRLHDSEKRASNALEILAENAAGGGNQLLSEMLKTQREQNEILREQMLLQQEQMKVRDEMLMEQQAMVRQLIVERNAIAKMQKPTLVDAEIEIGDHPGGADDVVVGDTAVSAKERSTRMSKFSAGYIPPSERV